MSLPLFTVDAFTSQAFSGNPAAVCLVVGQGGPMPEARMKLLAREMNLSETAFVEPLTDDPSHFGLRWLTPTVEVALCGHATLASAHVLFNEDSPLRVTGPTITFETKSGPLIVCRRPDGLMSMDFPQGDPQPQNLASLPMVQLLAALGLLSASDEHAVVGAAFCARTRKLILEVSAVSAVTDLKPSSPALLALVFPSDICVRGVIVTACTRGADGPLGAYDFVSRYFSPWNGIDEDPVTGSAHTALGPYWRQRLGLGFGADGKCWLRARQVSDRGGDVVVGVSAHQPESSQRTLLLGCCVTVVRGTLQPGQ